MPLFQRSPRQYLTLPQAEVEIKPPPPVIQVYKPSVIQIFLPLVGTLTMFAMAFFLFNGSPPIYLFLSLPIVFISFFVGAVSSYTSWRKNQQERDGREAHYRDYLAKQQQLLETNHNNMRQVYQIIHPSPQSCLQRAERREAHLWERSTKDTDFLELRLGIGSLPSSFTIKPPALRSHILDPLEQAAQDLADQFAQANDVTIALPLGRLGIVGLAAPTDNWAEIMRPLLIQLTTHHSPDEVKLVLIFPENQIAAWQWARWLPHTWRDNHRQRFMFSATSVGLESLLDLLRQPHTSSFVFVIADPELFNQANGKRLLEFLLKDGKRMDMYGIFLAPRSDQLRQECRAIVDFTTAPTRLRLVGPPPMEYIFKTDSIDLALADQFARLLAPLRLSQLASHQNEMPVKVTLLELLQCQRLEDLAIPQRWSQRQGLAIPIGKRMGGSIQTLDLSVHGPHGLVAGTTGSGKSKLLQTLIIMLAVQCSPHELAFLFLDYKGGDMANAFQTLPHHLGTLTNLDKHLTQRALLALKGELERRQNLFKQAGVNDIGAYQKQYQQKQVAEPLPRLVVIADEFAELKQHQPDFIKELVSTARLGRSLGIHLILATQKPSGIVDGQIESNTRFRLCLRVERPEDSQEMLKRPEAATLREPGRAYLQVGLDEIFELFQTGWVDAPYSPQGQTDQYIAKVSIDGTRQNLWPLDTTASAQTQLEALVVYLEKIVAQMGLVKPPTPWLPPLPSIITLENLLTKTKSTWLQPIIGLIDNPTQHTQKALTFPLGHGVIFGAAGSGKSTALQSLIVSLCSDHTPTELHLYLLDFGSRMFKFFEPLPHVGGVVLADEREQLYRLFQMCEQEIKQRQVLFSQAGVSSLAAYRQQNAQSPAGWVIVLDNYPEFAKKYGDLVDRLELLLRQGSAIGLHVVLTASTVMAIPARLGSYLNIRLALELADLQDYSIAVGRTNDLTPPKGVPGRGLINYTPPLEIQLALPVSGATESERTQSLQTWITQTSQSWQGVKAKSIPTLPRIVQLSQLLALSPVWKPTSDLTVPLGLNVDTLEPVTIDLATSGHFLIAGPTSTGKSTLLQTWLMALAESVPPSHIQFYLLDFSNTLPYADLPHTVGYARTLAELPDILEKLKQLPTLPTSPTRVLAIDDFSAFGQSKEGETYKQTLSQLLQQGRSLKLHGLLAGLVSSLNTVSYADSLIKVFKEGNSGFLVGHNDPGSLFNNVKLLPNKFLPTGQAYLIQRGQATLLQLATNESEQTTWIEAIKQKKQV